MRRTYHGRILPRPEAEVVDQGLGFDLDTLTTRRRMLSLLGIGTVGLGLAACGTGASTEAGQSSSTSTAPSTAGDATGLAEIPDETAGPYPGDGSNGPDVLEQAGVIRSDIRSS